MNYHFRNLVFEGGGIKGIAYIGALEVLERKGILGNIQRVGGTSAGAIISLLLALNYTNVEIKEILWNMDFKKFMDGSWGVIRNTDRLLKEFGWYKGNYFMKWIGNLINQKTGSMLTTFDELDKAKLGKQLYLIGTNLSTGYAEIFSNIHSPNMPLVEAVRISMSMPIFFTAVRVENNDVCVDGGVLENYPIKLFDKSSFIYKHSNNTEYYNSINKTKNVDPKNQYVFNMETLGFRLDSNKDIKVFEGEKSPESIQINNFFEYIKRLVFTMLDSQQNRHLHSDDWQRTIYIDSLGIKTTDFEISEEKKKALVLSGTDYTEKYLNWFESTRDNIANRPIGFYEL